MGIFDEVSKLGQRLGQLVDDVVLPDGARQKLLLAGRLLGEGDLAAAEETATDAAALAPGHAPALQLLALCRLRRREPAKAVEAAEQALLLRERFPEASIVLGEALGQLGRWSEAQAAYRTALQAADGGSPALVADIYRGLGAVYAATGRFDRAARELRKAVAASPNDHAIQAALGCALVALGKEGWAEARAPLERVARSPSPPREALLALGQLELAETNAGGAGGAAVSIFARLLETHPEDIDALAGCAEAKRRADDLPGAHAQAVRALGHAPERADLHLLLARIHEDAGSHEAALAAVDQALALDGLAAGRLLDPAAVLETAVRIALRAGDTARAEAYARRRQPAPASYGPLELSAIGAARLSRGDLAGAKEALARSIAAGDTADARLAMGRLLLEQGEASPAAASFQAAVQLADVRDDRPIQWLRKAFASRVGEAPVSGDVYELARSSADVLAAAPSLAELGIAAERVLSDLDRPLLLTVMGEFNSGKSTFINSLIGEEVAPTGILPTTATINVLQYGAERRGRVVHRDGRARELAWSELATALRSIAPEEAKSIRWVELLFPAEELLQVNVVDTPGLNSIVAEHEEIARSFIQQADAVIWLFAAGQAGKESERRALEQVRAAGKRVLGVVNKADRLTERELAQVLESLPQGLAGLLDDIVPYSARDAVAGRIERDPARLTSSRYAELRGVLDERFFSRARLIKRGMAIGRLGTLLEEASARVARAIQALDEEAAAMDAEAQALRAALTAYRGERLDEERRRLAYRVSELRREAAEEVLDFVRPRRWPFGGNEATPADREFLRNLLSRKLDAALGESEVRMAAALVGLAPARRLAELEAAVYGRARAYVRGFLGGGAVDGFFQLVLPKLALEEDSIAHALPIDKLDLEAELIAALAALASRAVEETLAGHAERRRALLIKRVEIEEKAARPIERIGAALARLAQSGAA